MNIPRHSASCLAVASICLLSLNTLAHARVVQQALVRIDTSTGRTEDGDRIDVPTGVPITTDVLAQISGPFNGLSGDMSASVGRFGNLGMDTAVFGGGDAELFSQVFISSDEFVNVFGFPQRAEANFIIDGGSLFMEGDLGTFIDYQIALQAFIYDNANNFLHRRAFVSNGLYEQTTAGKTFTPSGDDIGAAINPINGEIEIPLSFQSLDLGIIPPGGHIEMEYLATFESEIVTFAEILAWQFSDPSNIDGFGDFPTVTFSAIPEPTSLATFGVALLGLFAFVIRVRHNAQRCDPRRATG